MSGISHRERMLKVATGDLVDDLGGLKVPAGQLGKGTSTVHRWTSPNDHDNFIPLRDVAELERIAARPHITIALAKLAGGVFLPLPEDFGEGDALPLHVVELAKELGDVSGAVTLALADGKVDKDEAAGVETQLDELIEAAAKARAVVRAMQGKPAAEVRVVEVPAAGKAN